MISPRRVNRETRAAYDRAASRYDELFRDELEGKPFDGEILRAFADRLRAGGRVCDAGCGPCGHVGRIFADRGARVVGLDLSKACLERTRDRDARLAVVQGDIGDLPFHAGAFDGIVAYYSVVDTPKAFVGGLFREMHRVLRPGGSLLAVVKEGRKEGYQPDLLGLPGRIYMAFFSPEEIRGYLDAAGFRIETIVSRPPCETEIAVPRIFALAARGI